MPIIAVDGNPNTAGAGNIRATAQRTFITGLRVARLGDPAFPDAKCNSNPHCFPIPAVASTTVFAEGKPIHRVGDLRLCGDLTVVGVPTVFVGG